jgi:hypothetical protein
VFENGVLMRIFGPKRDEVTGEWIKLHKEKLSNKYSSPSLIGIMKWRNEMGGACRTNGGEEERI